MNCMARCASLWWLLTPVCIQLLRWPLSGTSVQHEMRSMPVKCNGACRNTSLGPKRSRVQKGFRKALDSVWDEIEKDSRSICWGTHISATHQTAWGRPWIICSSCDLIWQMELNQMRKFINIIVIAFSLWIVIYWQTLWRRLLKMRNIKLKILSGIFSNQTKCLLKTQHRNISRPFSTVKTPWRPVPIPVYIHMHLTFTRTMICF